MSTDKKTIPWVRITAEGVAIVASILLAFGIDAWWDARSERAQTSQLLQALYDEWQTDLEKIELSLEQGEIARGSIATVIAISQGQRPDVDGEMAAELLLSMFFSTYKPSFGALNSLLLTDLDSVSDRKLSLAIASWEGVLDEIAPEQAILHETGLVDMRRALARVAVDSGHDSNSAQIGSELPVRFGLPVDRLAQAAFRDEGFLQAMTHRGDVIRTYIDTLIPIREILVENLSLLEQQLGPQP